LENCNTKIDMKRACEKIHPRVVLKCSEFHTIALKSKKIKDEK